MNITLSSKQLCLTLTLVWSLVGCRSLPSAPMPPAPTSTAFMAIVTPIPNSSTTLTPLPTLVADRPTPSAVATLESITPTVTPRLYDSYPSPDGNWRAEVVIAGECIPTDESASAESSPIQTAYEQLTLINLQNGVEHKVDSQSINCGGLGGYGLAGLFWSANSHYFYYTDARTGGPDGCGYWTQPISRLEVETLDTIYFGVGPRAPDGSRFATWDANQLSVWEIEQDTIVQWTALVTTAVRGPIAWSPDGQALAYIQLETGCPFGHSYVVHVDLATGEQTLLLESEDPTFANVVWEVPEALTLFDGDSVQWRYHLATGELEQASSTP